MCLYLQQKCIHQQSLLHPNKQVHQLQRLSNTRWACRYLAVEAVCSTYDVILATLQAIVDGEDKKPQVLFHRFDLIALVLFWRILFCTKSFSDQLQSSSINMAKAADLVNDTLSDLEWGKPL